MYHVTGAVTYATIIVTLVNPLLGLIAATTIRPLLLALLALESGFNISALALALLSIIAFPYNLKGLACPTFATAIVAYTLLIARYAFATKALSGIKPLYFIDLIPLAAYAITKNMPLIATYTIIYVFTRAAVIGSLGVNLTALLLSMEPFLVVMVLKGRNETHSNSKEGVKISLGIPLAIVESDGKIIPFLGKEELTLAFTVERSPHLAIVGLTGSGKSSLIRLLAAEAWKNRVCPLIIDPHGEHRDAIRSEAIIVTGNDGVDVMDFTSVTVSEHIDFIIDYFKRVYRIGPRQEYVLREALRNAYSEAGYSENDTIYRETVDPKAVGRNIIALGGRDASTLTLAMYFNDFVSKLYGNLKLDKLFAECRPVIVNLEGLRHENVRVIVEYILRKLFSYAQRRGFANALRVLVLVDEAHLVASPQTMVPAVQRIVAEGRKYGIAMVFAVQAPNQLDQLIQLNVGTIVLLSAYDYATSKRLVEGTALAEASAYREAVKILSTLGKGFAIIASRNDKRAYIVDIRH